MVDGAFSDLLSHKKVVGGPFSHFNSQRMHAIDVFFFFAGRIVDEFVVFTHAYTYVHT
jgi:hypothetical protein